MRAGAFKCTVCGRKFTTRVSLLSHKARIHNIYGRPPSVVESKSSARLSRKGFKPSFEKPKAEIAPTVANKNASEGVGMPFDREIHFACPKCDSLFKKNFTAIKHIQKNHCVNEDGKPVLANSEDLIKPILREKCMKCGAVINSEDFHLCAMSEEELGLKESLYGCLGCQHSFPTMRSFDFHVPGVHKEGFQCMFFPTKSDADEWIQKVELLTKSKYACMFSQGGTQVYRCTFMPSKDNSMLSCPSSLQVHEFPNGYQVRFYTKHFGHKSLNYIPKDIDKSNLITSYFLKAESYHDIADSISDPKDQYVQFKNLMEKIILEAAKVNTIDLKKLMGKALDMSQSLNTYINHGSSSFDLQYEKDHKSIVFKDDLTDDQINNVLQDNDATIRKKSKPFISRRNNNLGLSPTVPLHDKKRRRRDSSPKLQPQIVDTFSLNENVTETSNKEITENNTNRVISAEETKNMVENKKGDDVSRTSKANYITLLSELPSFNDSYKNFIGKALKPLQDKTGKPPKKEIVKTKMGQFNPKSPKKKKSESKLEKQLAEPVSIPLRHSPPPVLKRKPKDVAYPVKKSPINKPSNLDKPLSPTPVETQISSPSPPPIPKRKPKDIVYEVMEQENDCNILVLKI